MILPVQKQEEKITLQVVEKGEFVSFLLLYALIASVCKLDKLPPTLRSGFYDISNLTGLPFFAGITASRSHNRGFKFGVLKFPVGYKFGRISPKTAFLYFITRAIKYKLINIRVTVQTSDRKSSSRGYEVTVAI